MRRSQGSSVLDKARSALKGAQPTTRRLKTESKDSSDDEALIKDYTSKLTKKATGRKPTSETKILAGLSDISISSDDAPVQKKSFLKSANKTPNTPNVEPVAKPSLSAPQRSVSSAPQSAALARFSQQSEKFMIKKSGTPLPKNTLRYSEDTQTSEMSEPIGKGNKFLKQPGESPKPSSSKVSAMRKSMETTTDDDTDMAAYIQGLTASEISDETSIKVKTKQAADEPKYDSSFATETFSADSSVKSEKHIDDVESEIATDSEGLPGLNLGDIRELEPALPTRPTTSHSPHRKHTPHRSKSPAPAKSALESMAGVLGNMGLMSVDDLMQSQTISSSYQDQSQRSASTIKTKTHDTTYRQSFDAESSIHTYKSESHTADQIKTASISDEYKSDFSDDDTMRGTESIKTEASDSYSQKKSSHISKASSYSSDTYTDYSATHDRSRSHSASHSYSKASRTRSRSGTRSHSRSQSLSRGRSGSRTRSQISDSRSKSRSRAESVSRNEAYSSRDRASISPVYSDAYSEEFEEVSEPSLPQSKPLRRGLPVDAQVQTGLDLEDMILKYYWMSDQAIPTTGPAPQSEVIPEPAKVTGLGISSEALEVLTTYNPAALALNDMMKQQIKLSQQFLNMQRDLHRNIMESVEKEHQYTTLEDTKEYIKSHRRPVLTFDEALKMVQAEMDDR